MVSIRNSKAQDKIIETLLSNRGDFSVKELLDLTKLNMALNSFYRCLNSLINKDILVKRGGIKKSTLVMSKYRIFYINYKNLNVEKWGDFLQEESFGNYEFYLTLKREMLKLMSGLRSMQKAHTQIKANLINDFSDKQVLEYYNDLSKIKAECEKLSKLIEDKLK